MKLRRRRMLPLLLAGLGRDGARVPGERAGARDRGQGRPADPRVAVQLGGGDRAGGLVRRAVDPVDAPQLQEPHRRRLFAAAGAAGMAGEPGRRGTVRAGRLQRVRRRAGHAGELLGDVHLRHLLGRHAGRERAVRRRLPSAQPVADVRARAARRCCACCGGAGVARRTRCCATRSGSACGRRSPGSWASRGSS